MCTKVFSLCIFLIFLCADAIGSTIEEDFGYIRKKHPALEEAVQSYLSGNKQDAVGVFKQTIALLQEQSDPALVGMAYLGLGHCYIHSTKTDSALLAYQIAFNILEHRDGFLFSRIANAIATIYQFRGDYKKAIYYNNYYHSYLKSHNKLRAMASNYRQIGGLYLNLDQYEKAKIYLDSSLNLYSHIADDAVGQSRNYNELARYHSAKANIHEAINFLLLSLNIFEKHPEKFDDGHGFILLLNIAENFLRINNPKKAEKYTKKALSLSEDKKYSTYKAYALVQMGSIFEIKSKPDSAILVYQKALEIFREKNQIERQISTLRMIGKHLKNKGEFVQSEQVTLKGLGLAKKLNNPAEIKNLSIDLAALYTQNNAFKKAEHFLKQATSFSYKAKDLYSMRQISLIKSELYQKKGDYKIAFEHQKKAKIFRDSILDYEKRKSSIEMEEKYESEKKAKQLLELDLQNKLKIQKIRQDKKVKKIMLFGIGAMLLALAFIFRLYQKNKKQKEVIAQALEHKDALLKEIHHRVKNNLQTISSLLSIQSRQINDTVALNAINESKSRVKSMALIHQNLYQEDSLIGVDMQKYIDSLVDDLLDTYRLEKRINVRTDVENILIDVDTIIPLGLILNELITNALKYAFEQRKHPQMRILFKRENDTLVLSVEDNGRGLPDDFDVQSDSGMGFKLVQLFVKKLKGTLQVTKSNGTRIIISFPSKKAA